MKPIYYLTYLVLTLCSCNQNQKENELIAKENELLKKENSLLKQEQSITEKAKADSISKIKSQVDKSITDKEFTYKTFFSSRGFKIDYPSFMTMGAPPMNDDGREFLTDGGVIRLWVYSSHNVGASLNDRYNEELTNEGSALNYKVFKSNWYVV